MVDLRRDWLDHMGAMQNEMERFLEHFAGSKPPAVRFSPQTWSPAVDIYETEEQLVVIIELAGVSTQDLGLIVENNVLLITGRRQDKHPDCKRSYCQMEVSWGPFYRALPLPAPVDGDKATAEVHDGLVEVFLPKVKDSHIRSVQITIR